MTLFVWIKRETPSTLSECSSNYYSYLKSLRLFYLHTLYSYCSRKVRLPCLERFHGSSFFGGTLLLMSQVLPRSTSRSDILMHRPRLRSSSYQCFPKDRILRQGEPLLLYNLESPLSRNPTSDTCDLLPS